MLICVKLAPNFIELLLERLPHVEILSQMVFDGLCSTMPKVLFKAVLTKEHIMLNTVELCLVVLNWILLSEIYGCTTIWGVMIAASVSLVTVESKIDLFLHLFLEHFDLDFILLMIYLLLTRSRLVHFDITGCDNLLLDISTGTLFCQIRE